MPGKSHGQSTPESYIHKVTKSQTWLKGLSTHTYIVSSYWLLIFKLLKENAKREKIPESLIPNDLANLHNYIVK